MLESVDKRHLKCLDQLVVQVQLLLGVQKIKQTILTANINFMQSNEIK